MPQVRGAGEAAAVGTPAGAAVERAGARARRDGGRRAGRRARRHRSHHRSKTGRVGCGCHEDRRPRRRWTDANSLSNSHSRLSYWSYRKSAVREPPARRRRERCHEGSRWRPSPGSLAQPTTLRDRRPIVMSLSRTGAPLEVMFIDSKALLIAKGGKGTLDPHACNPRAAAHHCSARDTVAGPTPICMVAMVWL